MKAYEASSTIAARPDKIWSVLTDGDGFSKWDSGVDRVEGRIAPGETIKVYVKVNPGRAFPVKVTEFTPPQRMVWSGGMPLGLFKGVRTYTLSPQANGTTTFNMREEYTGPMLPMIWKSIPDLGPSFIQFANGLKQRVEGGPR
ncbi:MAG TPA: SRPBCC domain-containing protein [Candidatus Dormibacteraeota bacterium]|nr:SRPBCC domain-containing protein [Candidatus Dormibacteraeota bacterium]